MKRKRSFSKFAVFDLIDTTIVNNLIVIQNIVLPSHAIQGTQIKMFNITNRQFLDFVSRNYLSILQTVEHDAKFDKKSKLSKTHLNHKYVMKCPNYRHE